MELSTLLKDDDAVSPVIGVILMVAVTVILAAVIGAFVLGIGEQPADVPQAQWETDETTSSGEVTNVTFTHDGGESDVRLNNLVVVANNSQASVGSSGTISLGGEISVSFSSSNQIDAGEDVLLVWSSGNSEQVIARHTLTEPAAGGSVDSASVN